MKFRTILPALALACVVAAAADAPPPLVIVDANGKEQKVKAWKFSSGTRPLGWLAPAPPAREVKPGEKPAAAAEAGPVAVAFRDEHSTGLVDGVLTLLLPEHLKSLEYDAEKQTVTARLAGDKADADVMLTGSTQYAGINKLTVEAEVDKGDAGIAEVKFQGGVVRGVRAIRFPAPKPAPAAKGRPAFVAVADKDEKSDEELVDLLPLYRLPDGSERLLPTLMFKKTLKLDVGKIARFQAEGREADGTTCRVTTKDGEDQTYTLLKTATIDDKPATLEGLVGKVRGGYKLFPASTFASMHLDVQFDARKGPEKP
jgi:hypothetical protein